MDALLKCLMLVQAGGHRVLMLLYRSFYAFVVICILLVEGQFCNFDLYLFRWVQIKLARDMGYTAARFGHVMFPENVYEPVLECAELLLQGVGKG